MITVGIAFAMLCTLLVFKAIAGALLAGKRLGWQGSVTGGSTDGACWQGWVGRQHHMRISGAHAPHRMLITNPNTLHTLPQHWRVERRLGRPLSFDPSSEAPAHAHVRLPSDDSAAEEYVGAAGYGSNGNGGDLEMSGLVLKTYAPDGNHHA